MPKVLPAIERFVERAPTHEQEKFALCTKQQFDFVFTHGYDMRGQGLVAL